MLFAGRGGGINPAPLALRRRHFEDKALWPYEDPNSEPLVLESGSADFLRTVVSGLGLYVLTRLKVWVHTEDQSLKMMHATCSCCMDCRGICGAGGLRVAGSWLAVKVLGFSGLCRLVILQGYTAHRATGLQSCKPEPLWVSEGVL